MYRCGHLNKGQIRYNILFWTSNVVFKLIGEISSPSKLLLSTSQSFEMHICIIATDDDEYVEILKAIKQKFAGKEMQEVFRR